VLHARANMPVSQRNFKRASTTIFGDFSIRQS